MGSEGMVAGLAARVQQARDEAGLSTLQLAKDAGIAYSTLDRRLKSAPGQFTVQELEAIAAATKVRAAWLIMGIGAEPVAA